MFPVFLLLLPWFTNPDFWALLPNANVSRRKKWKLVPFATAGRNKTDIIEIESLRYIPSGVHWKGQISPVVQIESTTHFHPQLASRAEKVFPIPLNRKTLIRDFWALLLNANVSRRKKWILVPFATARRNKTDIIEIELLCCIPSDVHWKGQISPVMQIWCAFELKLTPRLYRYFLQILLHLALSLSFNTSFIYYFNYHRRIKCAKDRERFELFPHRSHKLFWDSQYANSNSVQCSVN